MKSAIFKRSVVIAGHKTSLSLEDTFWNCLREIAKARGQAVSDLIASIDRGRQYGNLSSTIRLFVLGHYQDQIAPRHEPKQNGGAVALVA